MEDSERRRLGSRVALLAVATAVGLVGCAGTPEAIGESPAPSQHTPDTRVPSPSQGPSAETAVPVETLSPIQSASASVETTSSGAERSPDRSEMDEYTLQFAETIVVAEVRKLDIGQLYSDQELIDAAHVNCDSWESGKPIRGVLVEVAEALPRLESTEAVAQFAGLATGILCPRYLDEVGSQGD